MLSYMLPVEEKTSPRNLNLNLNLNGNGSATMATHQVNNGNTSESDNSQSTATSTTKLINFEQRASSLKTTTATNNDSRITYSSNLPQHQHLQLQNPHNNLDNFNATTTTTTNSILTTTSGTDDSKKIKMTKIGNTKNVTLKR